MLKSTVLEYALSGARRRWEKALSDYEFIVNEGLFKKETVEIARTRVLDCQKDVGEIERMLDRIDEDSDCEI